MSMVLGVIGIFLLSIAVGAAIGSALARLVLAGMSRGLVAARRVDGPAGSLGRRSPLPAVQRLHERDKSDTASVTSDDSRADTISASARWQTPTTSAFR